MGYTAENLSLAALELFVHVAEQEEPSDLMAVQATLPLQPEALLALKKRSREDLGTDWQYRTEWSREFGSAWAHAAESLVLPVPSAIIPEEWNLLLNPAHPEFSGLEITSSRAFRFDERMFQRQS